MRFRAKFGSIGITSVALACFYLFLLLSTRHPEPLKRSFAAVFILLASLKVLSRVFIYWDLKPTGLRERRMWHTREVPWQEIASVGSWNPKQPASDCLAIDYARPAPLSDRGRILASPADRKQFIAAVRRFAPHAAFDPETERTWLSRFL
jgi:hypothetical protein